MFFKRILALILCAASLCLVSCDSEYTETEFETVEADALSNSDKNIENSAENSTKTDTVNADSELNERGYYTLAESGEGESVTLMLYMCGSDLESKYGCATADLNEILYAELNDENVNVIVQTGGTSQWDNSLLDSSTCQRMRLASDGIQMLDEDVGLLDMTQPETLSDFITYCAESYPADRYMLVMWDHGGGTAGGFAYDENFPDSPSMSLAGLDAALYNGGVIFDMIGFDACLMSTVECAFVMERYADFLVASQDPEPGYGWYYTNWLTELSADSSISVKELSQTIVDDFVSDNLSYDPSAQVTLAVTDLSKVYSLYDALYSYLNNAGEALRSKDFARLSKARYDAGRGFEDDCDQLDLVTLANTLEADGAEELTGAFENCVVYESSRNVSGRNGMNIYFPYEYLDQYSDIAGNFSAIGMGDDYVSFMSSFVTVMAGGQTSAESATYTDSEWFDESVYDEYSDYYDENSYNSKSLEVVEKGDNYVLELTEDDWSVITSIETQVLFDDGEGYVDLGSDNVWETDEDGALIISFDNTWVALDGEYVCFYYIDEFDTEDGWSTSGYVPVMVNGEYAELIVKWDSWHEEGYVAGYRRDYESNVSQKGLFQLAEGDTLQYVCDYYDYDMNYSDTYIWGDEFVYDGELSVSYEDIGQGDCIVVYALTDVYGNVYYTEPVLFYD